MASAPTGFRMPQESIGATGGIEGEAPAGPRARRAERHDTRKATIATTTAPSVRRPMPIQRTSADREPARARSSPRVRTTGASRPPRAGRRGAPARSDHPTSWNLRSSALAHAARSWPRPTRSWLLIVLGLLPSARPRRRRTGRRSSGARPRPASRRAVGRRRRSARSARPAARSSRRPRRRTSIEWAGRRGDAVAIGSAWFVATFRSHGRRAAPSRRSRPRRQAVISVSAMTSSAAYRSRRIRYATRLDLVRVSRVERVEGLIGPGPDELRDASFQFPSLVRAAPSSARHPSDAVTTGFG